MCSPDEGPRRTETSYFLMKSLESKCHAHIFLLLIYICAYVCIRICVMCMCMHVYVFVYVCVYVYIYNNRVVTRLCLFNQLLLTQVKTLNFLALLCLSSV